MGATLRTWAVVFALFAVAGELGDWPGWGIVVCIALAAGGLAGSGLWEAGQADRRRALEQRTF